MIERLASGPIATRIVVHEEGPLTRLLEERGLTFERLALRRYLGRDTRLSGHVAALMATLPRLTAYLRRTGIDLVHSNDARMHLTWALPARLAGAKMVWHQRNVYAASRLTEAFIRLPQSIVANSAFVAEQLPAAVAAKVTVIDNPFEAPPVEREACRRALLHELQAAPESAVVGHFGNLIAWKRPLDFVQAAREIALAHEAPVVFAVFGEDRDGLRPQMEAIAAAGGIGERLRFLGFRQPVWPWLAACDLVLAPAVNEPFGRVLVEAMLVGTAVVATDSGGHREIVETDVTGLLVPPEQPRAMARAALELLGDGTRRARLADRARAAAAERFAAQRHAEAVTALYERLAGPSGGARRGSPG